MKNNNFVILNTLLRQINQEEYQRLLGIQRGGQTCLEQRGFCSHYIRTYKTNRPIFLNGFYVMTAKKM